MKPKIKRDKIYNFRVSEDELRIIRELAREGDLPGEFRDWINKLYKEHTKDPDEQVYKL